MRKSGFTLIELMVAMVVGLTAITSVYSLGAAMSEQFYEEQRTATSQGASRAAIMELRRDISRAGLFGSPNAQSEARCEAGLPELPKLGGGNITMGAFQHYPDADLAVLDPGGDNAVPGVRADRLRILTSLYLTDQLLIDSVSPEGTTLILQTSNQAYRRTFAWGQAAGPFTGSAPDYLVNGTLGWDAAWGGETASWNGIGQKGARAFQTGSVLHIESPEGYHFFRTVFGKADNTENQVRLSVAPKLPVATACLPGAGEGSTVAPLQWVEYALVDPFDDASVGADFMDFAQLFDLGGTNAVLAPGFASAGEEALREHNSVMLVRRILNPADGSVRPNTMQVLAEFVSNFEVTFLVDRRSGKTTAPSDPLIEAETDINDIPQQVRSVLINLGIRSPIEDPSIPYSGVTDANTRFEVNPAEKGSARVRHIRIEIPVMSVARRNLK
ncbi:MAG: prepilin-type N-terminal cleavage/methylation domain-containing protein [Polyangiales bacterium]